MMNSQSNNRITSSNVILQSRVSYMQSGKDGIEDDMARLMENARLHQVANLGRVLAPAGGYGYDSCGNCGS